MLCCLIFSLTIGVEAGLRQPVLGFNDLKSGPAFCFFAGRTSHRIDLRAGFNAAFHEGRNPGYSVAAYGVWLGATKDRWLFAPDLQIGADYYRRELNSGREAGIALAYAAGIRMNLRRGLLLIYPALCFRGVIDSQTHAGFLGLHLGLAHEL